MRNDVLLKVRSTTKEVSISGISACSTTVFEKLFVSPSETIGLFTAGPHFGVLRKRQLQYEQTNHKNNRRSNSYFVCFGLYLHNEPHLFRQKEHGH